GGEEEHRPRHAGRCDRRKRTPPDGRARRTPRWLSRPARVRNDGRSLPLLRLPFDHNAILNMILVTRMASPIARYRQQYKSPMNTEFSLHCILQPAFSVLEYGPSLDLFIRKTEGIAMPRRKGQRGTLSRWFRDYYKAHPEGLRAGRNDVVVDAWRADHPGRDFSNRLRQAM